MKRSVELNKFGLSNWTMNDLCSVFAKYPNVKRVILFGSRAKGNYHSGSDIDLALVGDGIDHDEILRIYSDIDSLGLLYSIDLLDYGRCEGKPIGDHIDRNGKLFYQSNLQ